MKQYYYQDAGKPQGPYTKEEIIAKGLRTGTYVWYPGLEVWVRIETIPELVTPSPKIIHNSPTKTSTKNENKQPSKKTLAIISLCVIILLSFIGIKGNDAKIRDEIREISYVDPSVDFFMYVDKFYRDLEVYGIRAVKPENIIIKFSKLETTEKYKEYNGVSFGYNNHDDIIEIYINPHSWKQSSKARRYWLMYHELAHDVLNAEHVDAIPANEGKLMYPYSTNFEVTDMDEFIEVV